MLIVGCAVLATQLAGLVLLVLVFRKVPREVKVVVSPAAPSMSAEPAKHAEPAAAAEEDVRRAIRFEARSLYDYELEHVGRQQERLDEVMKDDIHSERKVKRPHGEYDPDQVRAHVLVRLKQQFPALPQNVEQLIGEEVTDAD